MKKPSELKEGETLTLSLPWTNMLRVLFVAEYGKPVEGWVFVVDGKPGVDGCNLWFSPAELDAYCGQLMDAGAKEIREGS